MAPDLLLPSWGRFVMFLQAMPGNLTRTGKGANMYEFVKDIDSPVMSPVFKQLSQ